MTSSIIGGKLCRCRPFGHYTRTTETKRARSSVTRALASSATFTEADTLEEDIHPAYKKYRTVFEHNSSQLRQIERDEAHNVILPEPTAQSMFNYVLGCIKFMLIPRPIRYLWYHIWVRLRSAYYPYHRKLVLKGIQLDYLLQQKADKEAKINRSMALRRFHWNVSLWENVVYRSSLLKDAAWSQISVRTGKLRQEITSK